MKALVIAPQPFFSPRGTPFSVYYRTLATAELGVDVDLLTYGQGEDVAIPGVRIVRIPRFSFLGPVKTGPSVLKLFLDVLLLARFIGLLLVRRYDFVHAHEEAVFFCRFLKPIFRFKLVYDMHSSLPQQLTNFNFTKSRLLIGLFHALEDGSISRADAVITICPDLAKFVLGRINDPKKHFLIENSLIDDVKLARPTPPKQDSTRGDIDDLPSGRRFIVYAGTLEAYQGIDLLLHAFVNVHRVQPDSYLVIVGGDPRQVDAYRALARELHLEGHCCFSGRVPQATARAYLKKAAVQVSPRKHGTNTPLKIYEQLASGIPLVATDIYSHTQVLTPAVAFLVKPEPAEVAQGILAALTDEDERQRRATAAKKLYADEYSRDVYFGKMKRLLELLS
jgi:glycosyltransferase involved in cell wall biosynthesis